jgi:hypothetical protein
MDDELISIYPPALRMPDLQDFFLVEMEHEAVVNGFGLNDGVPIIVGSAEPDAPEAQCAAVNLWKEPLYVRRNLRRAR